MTNIIEHTYTALTNTGELRLTEKGLQYELLRQMQELLRLFEEH